MPQASLLSHRTAQRITDLIEKNTSIGKTAQSSDGTFYQIRVVRIESNWSDNKCDAVLLDESGNDTDKTIELNKAPGIVTGTGQGDRVWAVYRGKWQPLENVCGHVIHTLVNDLDGPDDFARVNIGGAVHNVSCPLLGENDTISAGKKVVISKNLSTGRWEIIEAQCE